MKTRHQKLVEQNQKPAGETKNSKLSKVDELGIERGQNGEKGNTINPRNIRPVKEPAH